VRIDPKTGNRTLEQKIDKWPTCTGSTAKLNIEILGGIAGGPDGTAYVAVSNISNAVGIIAIKGASCSVVTMSGAKGFETKGTGPTLESSDTYRALKYDNGKIWALHKMTGSLMSIDVATGNRARVSSSESGTRVGGGDAKIGVASIAIAGSKVWTAGAWLSTQRDFILTDVSASNGQRTGYEAASGPSSYDGVLGVWVHPTKALLVLNVDNGIVLYDPATGGSNLLSN
jgi:hypothetical protein